MRDVVRRPRAVDRKLDVLIEAQGLEAKLAEREALDRAAPSVSRSGYTRRGTKMATATVKWFNDDRASDSSHRMTPARTRSEPTTRKDVHGLKRQEEDHHGKAHA
jgi:hypothetical protein